MDEHQELDGTLKPPTSVEATELPIEGLAQNPIEIKRLTLDEADLLRATRAFKQPKEPFKEWFIESLNNKAFYFSKFIIENCPEGKERSQALGQVHAALLWAKESGPRNG